MADIEHRKHPGVGVAGFAVTFALLTGVVFAFQTGALAGAGWAGGEYANTFVAIAVGAVVAGAVLFAAGRRTAWRTFGVGLLAGGGLGIAFVVVAIAVFWFSFSNSTF